jgi:hypothetical protein
MSRFYIDTELIDDGSTIDLISIGIVCNDGRELYLQSSEFNIYNANEWVKDNVFPHLKQCPHTLKSGMQSMHSHSHNVSTDLLWQLGDHQTIEVQCTFKDPTNGIIGTHADCPWHTREQIKNEVLAFINDSEDDSKPEFWGYYSGYDHVAFCQLFGVMADLPKGYPMLTYDLRQWLDMNDMKDVRQPDDSPHNALEDVRWIAETYKRLVK